MSTSTRPRGAAIFPLLFAVTVSASLAACGSSDAGTTNGAPAKAPEPTPPVADPVTPSSTPPLRDAIDPKIASALKAAGVDVTKPADLATILDNPTKLKAVMTSFTIALGTTCTGCHAKSGTQVDYEAETPTKNVARKMWSELVRGLQKKDGSAIYCDSCHQGKMAFLDRSDDRSLSAWMTENFVGKLARVDGGEHGCTTCHGDPFKGNVLETWSK